MLLMALVLGAAAALATAVWIKKAHQRRVNAAELVWNDVFRCEAIDSGDPQECASVWKRSAAPGLARAS